MTSRVTVGLAVAVMACLPGATARAEFPSIDSVIAASARVLAECDSQIVEMTFLTTVHERELRADGSAKKERTFRVRHYVRDRQSREIIEAMWEDGEAVTPSKLADEQAKRDEERLRRWEARRENPDQPDPKETSSISMLSPLHPRHRANYRFPAISEDTIDGRACWRVAVEPVPDDDKLVRGALWVEQGSYRPVAEEYEVKNPPGPAKETSLRLEHTPLMESCAVPRHIRIRGHGKAFLIIGFNFEVEMLLDSARVNPGLPDSLFEVVGDK